MSWPTLVQRMLTAPRPCRVTLSDEEAKRRRGQKTVIERMAPPTFDVAVEIIDRHCWRIHADVAQAVDALLRGAHPLYQPFLWGGVLRVGVNIALGQCAQRAINNCM